MSDNKSLLKQYEDGEISANRLFKEQDEEMAGQFFISFGIFIVLAFITFTAFLLKMFLS